MNMANNPIKGTLIECLMHWAEAVGGVLSASQLLATKLDVNQQTASKWVRGVTLPMGYRMILLEEYLKDEGYELDTDVNLSEEVLGVRRLLALGVYTADFLTEYLGYTEADGLLRALRGAHPFGDAKGSNKLEMVREILRENQDKLQPATPQASRSKAQPPSSTSRPSAVNVAGNQLMVQTLARLIQVALPLAKAVESDDYSDADREQLRQLVGDEDYFVFSNIINRLCGPRARAHYRGEEYSNGK